MGKVQSKQGECYVLNAHLNPVCQLDDDSRRPKMPLTSQKFCSELSLSLCEMEQMKPLSEKCPLKVFLPPKDSTRQLGMEDTKREKAEEEKSEKEEKKNVNFKEQAENTEFSFTLYDFNGHGQISNEDVERIVGRTISEALEKSLNLSSSNHTIQVHLAISPEKVSKNKSTQDQKEFKRTKSEKPASKQHCTSMDSLNPFCSSGNHTRNKYQSSSNKKISHINSSLQHHQNSHPHHRSRRKFSLTDDRNPTCINEGIPYEQQCSSHYSNHRPVPDYTGHQSRYLDLAGMEDSKYNNTCLKYECHGDEVGRTNICSQTNRIKSEKFYRHRRRRHEKQGNPSQPGASPQLFRNFSKEQRYNHVDMNSDLCDLVPEERYDWEHHGRSKSFDLHKNTEYPEPDSPKPQHHTNISGFPIHRHYHKHKEQEKEPHWNKLTKWMEKDFTNKNQRDNTKHIHQQEKDHCKHHHIHEHIHHHYHHYVNS